MLFDLRTLVKVYSSFVALGDAAELITTWKCLVVYVKSLQPLVVYCAKVIYYVINVFISILFFIKLCTHGADHGL